MVSPQGPRSAVGMAGVLGSDAVATPFVPRLAAWPQLGGDAGRRRERRGQPDVRLQRRRLGASDQARQADQQDNAGDGARGQPGDVPPADPRSAVHRALQPRGLRLCPYIGKMLAFGCARTGQNAPL